MSALPVARYLKELASDARGARSSELAAEASKNADAVARMAEAYARGLAEGKAAAQAEYEEGLARQQAHSEEKLAAERERWASQEGARLADLVVAGLRKLESRIADQVAQILKPVFEAQVQRRAVAELATALEGLLSNGDLGRLTVSGSEELLHMLSAQLNVKIANVTFNPSQASDLQIAVDETVLETRIAAWARAIQGDKA
jgi:hypothetical protein